MVVTNINYMNMEKTSRRKKSKNNNNQKHEKIENKFDYFNNISRNY